MKSFLAIFKQTLRAAVRSRVFHVLLVFILLAVFALPLTVTSDGTAAGELKLSLTYSLSTVTVLLSLATVWLGCIGLSREIETYQLHMVMTKPTPGWVVWSAKWLAVFGMNAAIFALAATLIYAFIMVRFHYQDFSEQSKAEARREVLVGRRSYKPDQPDFNALARERYEQMQREGRFAPDHDPSSVVAELKRQIRAQSTEIQPGQRRVWRFSGMDVEKTDKEITLRYRLYVDSTQASKQRMTNGIWGVSNPARAEGEQNAVLPQRVMSGTFHEIKVPAEFLANTERVFVQYVNRDPGGQSVIYQPEDGPLFLVPVTGFTGNWLRACSVILLKLAVLAALGCFLGAAFSPPVAVFTALSCLCLGAAAHPGIGEPVRGAAGEIVAWSLADRLAHTVAVILDKTMITLDAGNLAYQLARGRLVELLLIGKVVAVDFIIKGGLMAALGTWILSRRELGKVIKQ